MQASPPDTETHVSNAPGVTITREIFLEDKQGRSFSDVLNDPDQPFDAVLDFFSNHTRQRRMEESEIHHDRSPLAGVVRELESLPDVERFMSVLHNRKSVRFRQAVGVVVRMVMMSRGWRKAGRKGSLGVRAAKNPSEPNHNTGGLAFWFLRAERYELEQGMPFRTVRERCQDHNHRLLHNASDTEKTCSDATNSKTAVDDLARGDQS